MWRSCEVRGALRIFGLLDLIGKPSKREFGIDPLERDSPIVVLSLTTCPYSLEEKIPDYESGDRRFESCYGCQGLSEPQQDVALRNVILIVEIPAPNFILVCYRAR